MSAMLLDIADARRSCADDLAADDLAVRERVCVRVWERERT